MATRRVSRLIALLIVGGVATGLAAACSGSTSSPTAGPAQVNAGGGGGGRADAGAPVQPVPKEAPAQGNPQQGQVDQPGLDRKLVRTATLELAAANVAEVADGARKIAIEFAGFAGREEVKGDSAMITLHIPSNQFDRALVQLSELVPPEGRVSRSQTAEDVTEQLVDLDSRIATQRASVDRVRALLARAGTVNEIVQIEGEVTRREADLESLEKRREALSGHVALSKVTVRVAKGASAPKDEDDGGFLSGLIGGWDSFIAAGTVLLRVLGAMLPFLIVLGIPGWFALRWWLRRRKTMTPAPVTPAPAP